MSWKEDTGRLAHLLDETDGFVGHPRPEIPLGHLVPNHALVVNDFHPTEAILAHSAELVKHLLPILNIACICKYLNDKPVFGRGLDIWYVLRENKRAAWVASPRNAHIRRRVDSLAPPFTHKTVSVHREHFLLLQVSELPFFH